MSKKLTQTMIKGLTYSGNGTQKDIRWDNAISGFGIRIYPTGKKSFVMSYRDKGKKHLYAIGQYGKITLEQAREIAKKRFGDIADNKNPLIERQASKKKHKWTVRTSFTDFLNKYAKRRTKNWEEAKRIFDKDVIPVIGKSPIDEVTKDDILKILDIIEKRGAGIMANRTLAHISKFFNWCVERNLIPYSPAFKIANPAPSKKRDRVLLEHEIKDVWQASFEVHYPFGDIVRLLLLTGQRRGEVASMRWQDYDEKKKLWIIPREFTKSDREHYVPLSDMAIEVIENTPKMGDYIFTSSGKRPFENFSRDKKLLDTKIRQQRKKENLMEMGDWRIHDLRRTTASGLASLKTPPHVIEKILNHSSGIISGVAAVYNRYQYQDEVCEALDNWAEHLKEILIEDLKEKSTIRIN